jgi:ERF superfamily
MAEYGSFVAAFYAMQQELPEIAKDSQADAGPRGIMHYANLKTVTDAAYPLLARFGFMWSTQPTVDDSKPVLRYELTHITHTAENPQQRTGLYPIFGDNAPQKLGAAITYARRYALCAVLGLTPDKEEDAEGKPVAGKVVSRKPKAEPKVAADPDAVPGVPLPGEPADMMTRPQQGRIFALLKELGVSDMDRGPTVNRILIAAGQPAVNSFKELTIVTAGHVLTGLQREKDARTGGSDQPA